MPEEQGRVSEPVPATTIIGADVGGTYARLGWAILRPGEPIKINDFRRYACAEHPSLAAILHDYAAGLRSNPVLPPLGGAVVAIAGLLDGDRLLNTNLAWPVSLDATRRESGIGELELINDFVAVAQAIPHVARTALHPLSAIPGHHAAGPALVLGPGTGLGAALWIPVGERSVVLATEAGQAALAAGNELEMAVLQQMLRNRSHVSIEHGALSGPGLLNLYNALCAVRGATPVHATPDAVSAAACDGSDPLAVQTLELFCGILGSTIGDMALLYGVQGGIYLAGGILPKLGQFLIGSTFVERFLNKGPMAKALQRIPVKLVEHGQLGVIGAASWYLEKLATQASQHKQQMQ